MDAKLTLEMAVSGELTKLRLIERALHDSSAAWAIHVGDTAFPAQVEVNPTGVEFVAEVNWGIPGPVHGRMGLWVDDRPASRLGDEVTAEEGELLTWGLTLGSLAVA